MTDEQNLTNTLLIKVQKKNPKPNPKEYKLETIQDIFDMLDEKNINRFMKDFKQGMRISIAMRTLSESIGESVGLDKNASTLKMPSFTWIDD